MLGRVLSFCKQEKGQQMPCQFVCESACGGVMGLSVGSLQTQMAFSSGSKIQRVRAAIEGKI